MNRWIAAFAVLLLAATPAAAQKDGPTQLSAEALATAAPSAPAEGVARAFLIDSGIIDAAIAQAVTDRFADARSGFTRSPEYRALTAARRTAALAVFDSLPAILREELTLVMPAAARAFAVDLDRAFEPAHLAEIDTYLRSSAGQKLMREGIAAGLRGRGGAADGGEIARAALATMTDEEAAVTMRFVTSEAGVAFSRQNNGVMQRLQSSLMTALTPALAPTLLRMQTGLCDAMEGQCPRELRPRG